jgi:hypothetical protein
MMKFIENTQGSGCVHFMVWQEYENEENEEFDDSYSNYLGCLELGDDSWYRFRSSTKLMTSFDLDVISSKLASLNHEQWQATQDILKNLT